MRKIYFINVFGGIDCTENTETAEGLYDCGNYFEREADAIAARSDIKKILLTYRRNES